MKFIKGITLSLALLGGVAAFAQSTSPTTSSHGGTYTRRSGAPASGSPHKGGHYTSSTGNHHYGHHTGR